MPIQGVYVSPAECAYEVGEAPTAGVLEPALIGSGMTLWHESSYVCENACEKCQVLHEGTSFVEQHIVLRDKRV